MPNTMAFSSPSYRSVSFNDPLTLTGRLALACSPQILNLPCSWKTGARSTQPESLRACADALRMRFKDRAFGRG